VDIYVSLRPFDAFTGNGTEALSRRLASIVANPANAILSADFPRIMQAYGTPERARSSIGARRTDMEDDPTYAALAVMLGRSADEATVYGVTTMSMARIPDSIVRGPQMAIWLDQARPPWLKNIGRLLLRKRFDWLLQNRHFTGRPWTVIRPDNRGSWPVWTQGGLQVPIAKRGRVKPYGWVDGNKTPRQLFVATQPLEALR